MSSLNKNYYLHCLFVFVFNLVDYEDQDYGQVLREYEYEMLIIRINNNNKKF